MTTAPEKSLPDFPSINADVSQQAQARDVWGMFETVSAAPTAVPKNFFEQIKFYSNGGTYRIYIYDRNGAGWRYATLT